MRKKYIKAGGSRLVGADRPLSEKRWIHRQEPISLPQRSKV